MMFFLLSNIIFDLRSAYEFIKPKYKLYGCWKPIGDLYSSKKDVLVLLNELVLKDTMISFYDILNSTLKPYSKWEAGQWKWLEEWVREYDRAVIPI